MHYTLNMAKWQKIFVIICVIVVIIIIVINFIGDKRNPSFKKAYVGDNLVWVIIAQTPEERKQGLSGIKKLAKDKGMLFILADKQKPVFWMKNMNFALDVVWIANNKVVDLTENIPTSLAGIPDSKIVRFQPKTAVDIVLELNAGWIEEKNVKIGDEFYCEPI